MRFTVKKKNVINVLSKVQGLAGRKTNLAITTNVLIATTDSGIIIRATDLETGFEGFFPAQVETQGALAISARKFFEIVRDFPSEEINVAEIENNWIEIGNKNVEYHLVGMNPEDFPEIPKIEDIQFYEIDAATLTNMIEKTVYIGGPSDDKRAHIIGVFMQMIKAGDQTLFCLVSTDGSRLSKVGTVCEKETGGIGPEGVLVPKKGMLEVAKFLDGDATVQIGVKDNNFIIKKQTETIIIRLLEGEFPEYDDIVRKSADEHVIQLDRQLFIMMLKRMSILSTDEYKSVIFSFCDDNLVITSTNPEIGESKEQMSISFSGEKIEAAFNPRYYIDALNVMQSDNVSLNILNADRPCRLEGDNDDNYITIIMPMRI